MQLLGKKNAHDPKVELFYSLQPGNFTFVQTHTLLLSPLTHMHNPIVSAHVCFGFRSYFLY